MRLPFLNKAEERTAEHDDFYDTQHRLVIYDNENHSCEIYNVTHLSGEEVTAMGRAVVPIQDCTIHISNEGRVYTLNAPSEYIQEAKNLAALQQSTVLRQITAYREPEVPNGNMDLFKWALVFIVLVAVIMSAF